jgi:hypothetical protein
MIHKGTLVLTPDGYFGIVTNVQERFLFLSNGLEARQNEEDWAKNRVQPLNIYNPTGAEASFDGIERILR